MSKRSPKRKRLAARLREQVMTAAVMSKDGLAITVVSDIYDDCGNMRAHVGNTAGKVSAPSKLNLLGWTEIQWSDPNELSTRALVVLQGAMWLPRKRAHPLQILAGL